jgi:hypothetical protein
VTWLFTQVWLWSLAAFVLGALLSWLLFVPRLNRRIRWLQQDLADWEAAYDEVRGAPRPEPSGLDLLPGQEEVDGWERQRDWDRTRMSGNTARMAPVNGSTDPEIEPVEQQPAQAEPDDTDLRLEEQREVRTARIARPAEEAAPEPTAPAEGEIPEAGTAQNSWFRKPELEQSGDEVVTSVSGDLAEGATAEQPAKSGAAQEPLPKREFGAGPRPGPSAVSGVRIPGEPREKTARGKEQPHGGGMVKGHFSTRKYHTPDSPHYGEIEADVWFRTPADAEYAGFEPSEDERS